MDLSLSNVINISATSGGAGAGNYNTSNLAVFTHEVPAQSFGNLGYALYNNPNDVGTDFGTGSQTYANALSVFGQTPNILNNNGVLLAILMLAAIQTITPSAGTIASGTFVANFGGNASAAINWNDTAAQIQTKLRAVPGLATVVVTGSVQAGLSVTMSGLYGPQSLITISSNTLATAVPAPITLSVATTQAGETIAQAITRASSLVQFFGAMGVQIYPQADNMAAAAVIQTLTKIYFYASRSQADIQPGGTIDLIRQAGYSQSRGMYYGGTSDASALGFMASFAGRGLSVNFDASLSTITMHLKDLAGVVADPSMTQTILALAQAAGAECYVSLRGIPKTFTSQTNTFFDRVYNKLWYTGALSVAYFNVLAQTGTKIAQTEDGITTLKSALRIVCKQAVSNGYLAPGSWTDPNTFGNQADFLANISQVGYYIYTAPVSQQTAANRAARIAPVAQIASKEAGAVHSGNVQVNINA